MRTAPCKQKGLITENRARLNSIRSPSCLRCWGQTRSSSRNATESVSRQPIRDTQTPRLKGMTKLSHTRSVESAFLTYTTYLKRPGKSSANVAYKDILMEWKPVRLLGSVCICVLMSVCMCAFVCVPACIVSACMHVLMTQACVDTCSYDVCTYILKYVCIVYVFLRGS
jgi:hypothetical protein